MRSAVSAILAATVARRGLPPPQACAFSDDVTLESLRREQSSFVEERDWQQFHTPRSLALAMVGEVGELCELLQWTGDDGARPGLPEWTASDKAALSDELADVLSYVIRLADVTGIDLSDAFLTKLRKNKAKYPAEQVRGSAAKYTEYRQRTRETDGGTAGDAEAEGEWGTPQRISSAYRRAAARVYGGEAAEPTSAPPSTPPPMGAAETLSAEKPNPRQRAAAKVDRLLEGRRKMQDNASEREPEEQTVARAEGSNAEACTEDDEGRRRSVGVEVDSLDELWGFMEFGNEA